MSKFIEVFKEYDGEPFVLGTRDCNLMILNGTGYSGAIPCYSSLKEAHEVANKLGFTVMDDYLSSIGYKQINSMFISDFDIVIDGIHCAVYLDGRMFMYNQETNLFGFFPFNKEELKTKKVFHKWK